MKQIQPKNYISHKKLLCDWTDKKEYSIHYRMLKFYVTHAMVVDKLHEVISFKPSKWLEKHMNFEIQKQNKARNDFKKAFYKLLSNAFYGISIENVRNRVRLEFIRKDEAEKIIKQQSKLIFIEFINHMKNVIVLHLSKLMICWISQFIKGLLFWN